MNSLKQYLPESFLAELAEAPTDSMSPIAGGAEVPGADELARTENELQLDDHVTVVGNVQGRGKKGTITRFGSNKAFVVVQINGKDYSFHSSDVKRIDDDEEEDDDSDERELNNWRELAGIKR